MIYSGFIQNGSLRGLIHGLRTDSEEIDIWIQTLIRNELRLASYYEVRMMSKILPPARIFRYSHDDRLHNIWTAFADWGSDCVGWAAFLVPAMRDLRSTN